MSKGHAGADGNLGSPDGGLSTFAASLAAAIRGLPGTVRRSYHVVVPVAAALAVNLWGLDSTELWLDERNTLRAVSGPLSDRLWEAPLIPYYAVIKVWTFGGAFTSASWLRMSSVLAVAAAVGLTAGAARVMSTRWVGFSAGMVLVVAPGVSRYAQEARPYALAMMLVSGSTFILVRSFGAGPRVSAGPPEWPGVYAAVLFGAALMVPTSLAVLPAHGALMALTPGWREHLKHWARSVALLSPLAVLGVFALVVFQDLHDWLPSPSVADLPLGLAMPLSGEYAGQRGIAYGLIAGVLAMVSQAGRTWLFATAMAVGSVWLLSAGPMSWWLSRSLIPIGGLLAVAGALGASRSRALGVGALILLAVTSGPALVQAREPAARGSQQGTSVPVMTPTAAGSVGATAGRRE